MSPCRCVMFIQVFLFESVFTFLFNSPLSRGGTFLPGQRGNMNKLGFSNPASA